MSTQVSIFVMVTPGNARSAVVQIGISDGYFWATEQCMATGALAAGEQRFNLYDMAWGPLAPRALEYIIERPVNASRIRVGVYSEGVPAGGDTVYIRVVRGVDG
jgi:hypothetical protein